MSGGTFDYIQFRLTEVVERIKDLIKHNDEMVEGFVPYHFEQKTLDEFETAIYKIKEAQVYMQRIDWLCAGDDGEETFHERLKEELDEIQLIKKIRK